MMTRRTLITLLMLTFTLATAVAADAALLAHDDFNPAPSTVNIAGTSTGTGFTGAWADSVGGGTINRTGDNNNVGAYPQGSLLSAPAGGKAQQSTGFTDNSVTRSLAAPIDLGIDGTYYLSYLYNDYTAAASNTDREVSVFLGDAGGTIRLHSGLTYGTNGVTFRGPGVTLVGGTAEPFSIAEGANRDTSNGSLRLGLSGAEQAFIVARLVASAAGSDVLSIKGYRYTPGSGAIESEGSIVWDAQITFASSVVLNHLGIFMEGAGFPEIDSIRLTTSYAEAVGIPTPAALPGAIGLLGMAAARRRRGVR